jgi:UDP-glucose-4-epimerase GalE
MRVLITGSCGYIGSVLAERMRERGIPLLGCDNNLGIKEPPDTFIRRLRSSFDDDFTVNMITAYNIDVIVHLAATSTVGPDAKNPIDYYENNTAKTITFIKKLKDRGWKGHFIFASTAAVYASGREAVTEESFVEPLNVYGRSKQMCEQMLDNCWMYGIDVTTFRFFNVAGAYNGFGEEKEDSHLISRICSSVLSGEELTVYGDDYPTRDGTCVRDYVHVSDICDAIQFAIDHEVQGTYNLGTKKGSSVKEIIEQFEMHTGQKVKWSAGPRRPGDPPFLVADPGLYERVSGFQYTYSLRDIINSSWEHFKNGI